MAEYAVVLGVITLTGVATFGLLSSGIRGLFAAGRRPPLKADCPRGRARHTPGPVSRRKEEDMSKRRIDIRRREGQTMVEFVLVLPLLMLVLFGIIQFGITFMHYVALTDAVRAGARTAAVSRQSATRTTTSSKVTSSSDGLVPAKDITVTSRGITETTSSSRRRFRTRSTCSAW